MTDTTHAALEALKAENEALRAEVEVWKASFEQAASGHATYAERTEQQPTEGEEIMVNTPHGVFTLPLHPSGLSSGPRFVVYVPELQRESVTVRYDLSPAQTESAIRDALIRMGWTPPEGESAAKVEGRAIEGEQK